MDWKAWFSDSVSGSSKYLRSCVHADLHWGCGYNKLALFTKLLLWGFGGFKLILSESLLFIFICVGVLPVWVCMLVYHVHSWGQKRVLESLGLELQVSLTCCVGAGHWTWPSGRTSAFHHEAISPASKASRILPFVLILCLFFWGGREYRGWSLKFLHSCDTLQIITQRLLCRVHITHRTSIENVPMASQSSGGYQLPVFPPGSLPSVNLWNV